MLFSLSKELEMTRKVVRDFAEKEVAIQARDRDEEERFDRRLFMKMGGLGFAGVLLPEQYGGVESDFLTFTILLEELSKVCASTAAVLAAHIVFATLPLYKFGSEEQKRGTLEQAAQGTMLGGCCFPEFDKDQSDKTNKSDIEMGITAHKVGDEYILNGGHSLVINAGTADYYVIYVERQGSSRKGTSSAFIIERDQPGLSITAKTSKLGLRSLITGVMKLENCKVSDRNRLGKEGQGQEIINSIVDRGHISAAAQAVGLAQGALDAVTAYAKERRQFGIPIGRQQGISFKLADMSAKIEAARLLTYQAAWRLDEGLSFSKEAAVARVYATDMAVSVTIDAVQVFGGYGYMREYRMERLMRDAKCLQTELGTGGLKTDCISRILMA